MNRKLFFIALMMLTGILAACGGNNDVSEEDAERGINAAFAGNRDEAARYICEEELASVSGDTALAEGISADVSCEQDGDQMRCNVSLSGMEEGSASLTMTFDIEDGKLCNPEVALPE